MKVILMSMPDVAPLIIHETAIHMPSHGIACVGANIDPRHEVHIVDLIRKRRKVKAYVEKLMRKYKPDLVGLSAMAWQYDTCVKIAKVIRRCRPQTKIAIGGYHATLMYDEIANSPEGELFDFMIRGEGEIACNRLVNALAGDDDLKEIPSLSYRKPDGSFVHNEWAGTLDLTKPLKLPIRDKRRLTWGYHILYMKIELLETSRGCTRGCNFCSMRHMYGRSFRTYPVARVMADLDDIYYKRKCRWVFIVDDNMVLNPKRVIELCDAIIARGYRKLNLVVQADCISMSQNEDMVAKMAQAGFRSVFLGIESASKKNLDAAGKGNIVSASQKAVAMCHKYGLMVIGGLIFGFPDDEEQDIINNYQFLKDINADASYCQILTPYPKTGMREDLIEQGLVTNQTNYKKYSGLWANVKTRHLSSARLQYLFWLHRQKVLGFWKPSERARSQGRGWTGFWIYLMRPLMQKFYTRIVKRDGWQGRYKRELERLERMNHFPDLEDV